MITGISGWNEMLCCPLCLGELDADRSHSLFRCESCGRDYPVADNVPIMTGKGRATSGVKDATELEAQIDEHRDTYEQIGTNDRVKGRVAGLLAKHGVTTTAQSRILEIGCGPFESLHDAVAGVKIGVDILASSYGRDLPFRRTASNIMEAYAELLPFRDRSFDVIVTRNSFDHLNDPELALYELNRVLKKDGLLILECYLDSDPYLTHEPFVLTDRFIDGCITGFFDIVTRRRLTKPGDFVYDWGELLLSPREIPLLHRPYSAGMFDEVAESYLEMFARGFALLEKGDCAAAILPLCRSVEKRGNHFWNALCLFDALARLGSTSDASRVLQEMTAGITTDRYPYMENAERVLENVLEKNRVRGCLA